MLAIDGVPIRRRLGSAHARDRLAEALFEIAREGFDHAFTGPDAPAARAWLRVALERPITRATDAALDRFCAELGLAALAAPAHVRRSLAITDEDARGEPVSAVRAVRARHAREATSG